MHKIFKPALPLTGFLASFTPAEYNPENGTLKKVIDKSTNVAIYEPGSYNARGQMIYFGMSSNHIYTTFGYDNFGLPTYRMTGNYYPTSSNIQNLETNFDPETGNLNWRKDHKRSLTENFTYDLVHKNRLATWQVEGQQQYSTTYNDVNGNILTKTDFTSPGNPYSYGVNAGPHAVTGIVSPLIMPAEALQEISYNNFNKASRIIHQSQVLELVLHYGPDEQRIKTEYKINGQPTLTRYFPGGGLEVEVNEETNEERWLHYLPGGGLYVCDENFDKIGMYYVLTDYLGSWDKVISETGTTLEEYSFDPWGRRRNPTNWTYTGVPTSFIFSRGYTGHEMLDAFGLVNMNGRMYDPVLGRMLSPDNYVSLPEHTQGYNRYTYALNNPLIITDPSGDNPVLLFIAFAGVLNGAMSAQNGDGFLQGFAIGTATAALSYGVGTAVGTVVSGGKIWADMANAGIHTAITGGITYGADALVNNAAFNWKGYGLNIATSMAMAGLSYQKQGTQLPKYTRADLEAAGLQFDLGRGYGMRFGDPPGYVKVSSEEGLIKYNIPGTEIIAKRINKQSWLTQFWYSEYMRMKVPDHFALSFGLNSTFVRGQSMAWSINLLTRGKEPGFSITVTDMERKGGEIDWGFDLTISRYEGNPMDINKASLEGKVKSISATWGYGGEGYIGYNPSGKVIWKGASAGVGLSYGVSYGSGTTRQIWP